MTQDECGQWLRSLMDAGKLSDFYRSYPWKKLRRRILAERAKEGCADCAKRGRYRKADTVHHEKYVDKYPELALSEFYEEDGEQRVNLCQLCHDCHEKRHGHRKKGSKRKTVPPERW